MSDTQAIMKFELLPNEILIECFEYLNGLHIFYSFDQLNYRFNKLIRHIPLYLDFRNIHHKIICDQFCMKLLANDDLKEQIYSLHLSNNKDTCNKIQSFLSLFSLMEFIHLRSLTFTEVKINIFEKLKIMLPLMTELTSFGIIDPIHKENEILIALPIAQLRTLTIPRLTIDLKFRLELSSITYLTISVCYLDELYLIFNSASSLKYLKLRYIYKSEQNTINKHEYISNRHATNLKQLIISDFQCAFDDLFMILKHTPNLKGLTICSYKDMKIIDACEWEHLITSSLPYLITFKFRFECSYGKKNNTILEELKKFQSDFWHKEHHWFTEYSVSNYSASIYTLPYIFSSFELISNVNRYCNSLMNNSTTFDNVKDLTIFPDLITEKCQYHFSCITSLTLGDPTLFFTDSLLMINHIECLKMIVNLSNLKHLAIPSSCELETPFILTEILKETSQLSSLNIHPDVLSLLFDDIKSCQYLNKMIKQLNIFIDGGDLLDDPDELDQFCEVFINIEQLTCIIHQRDTLLFLLQHLPKLFFLNIYSQTSTFRNEISWLEDQVQKLGIKIITEAYDKNYLNFSIWIIRNID